MYLSIDISINRSISIYPSIYMYLSIDRPLSIHLSIYLSVYGSIYLSIYLSIYMYPSLSLYRELSSPVVRVSDLKSTGLTRSSVFKGALQLLINRYG